MAARLSVLLVTPINRSYVVMPSLGLGYLAAAAREAGHEVAILDCGKERLTHQGFARRLRERRWDVVGFQVFTYDLNSVKRHLALVRAQSPGTTTVAGGAHPSGDPTGTMEELADLDYAFRGEAEGGFPLLLDRLAGAGTPLADIPGLVHREEGGVVANPPRFVDDLDALPLPAWDLLRPETYPEAPHGAFSRRFPTAPIAVTRGCRFRCTFCSGRAITGPRVRARSLDGVFRELAILRGRGIREVHVEDENFTEDRSLVLEFCRRMEAECPDLTWSLPSGVRIDSLDAGMLDAMERAGCYSLALGIEFGTISAMERTRKKLTPEVVRERLLLFRGRRIKTTGFFLFGIPGESLAEMRETVRFALELPLDRAQFNNFIPLPGSELWTRLEAAGLLRDLDWDRFFVHDVAFAAPPLRPADLKRLQREAYLRFYLRPRVLRGVLGEIRSPRHLRYLLRRLLDALR